MWSKYCHTTYLKAYEHTSTSTLPQVLGLYDHTGSYTTISTSTQQKWTNATSVDSHDQMMRSTRPYTAESSLERPRVPKPSQTQSKAINKQFRNKRDIYPQQKGYLSVTEEISAKYLATTQLMEMTVVVTLRRRL